MSISGLKLLNTFINYSRYLTKELQISLICVNIQTRWVDQEVVDLEGKQYYTKFNVLANQMWY